MNKNAAIQLNERWKQIARVGIKWHTTEIAKKEMDIAFYEKNIRALNTVEDALSILSRKEEEVKADE